MKSPPFDLVVAIHSSESQCLGDGAPEPAHHFEVLIPAFFLPTLPPCLVPPGHSRASVGFPSHPPKESPVVTSRVRYGHSDFTDEKFELYKAYQHDIHKEKLEKCSTGFRRFLVETPLLVRTSCSCDRYHFTLNVRNNPFHIQPRLRHIFQRITERIISAIVWMANYVPWLSWTSSRDASLACISCMTRNGSASPWARYLFSLQDVVTS